MHPREGSGQPPPKIHGLIPQTSERPPLHTEHFASEIHMSKYKLQHGRIIGSHSEDMRTIDYLHIQMKCNIRSAIGEIH